MFGIFKKKNKEKKVKNTMLITKQNGFNAGCFNIKITDEELNVFRTVYKRSDIDLLVR